MNLRASITAGAVALATALPAHAALNIYTTTLTDPTESPPNASGGLGAAIVTIDTTTMEVQASFTGLTSGVTASHIHCCTAVPDAGAAGVATTVPTFTGFPSGVTSGTYDHVFDMTQASSWNPAFVTANGS